MIISEDIKIRLTLPISNEKIEKELKIELDKIIRWAITDCDGEIYTIRVSKEV